MSNPSFSNIDRWLFELVEGNLSDEQVAQLHAFLLNHPELDVDKDMWDLARVDFEDTVYPHQHKLTKRKRPIGLYSALGFASIGVFIYLGFQSFLLSPNVSENTTNSAYFAQQAIGRKVTERSNNVCDDDVTKVGMHPDIRGNKAQEVIVNNEPIEASQGSVLEQNASGEVAEMKSWSTAEVQIADESFEQFVRFSELNQVVPNELPAQDNKLQSADASGDKQSVELSGTGLTKVDSVAASAPVLMNQTNELTAITLLPEDEKSTSNFADVASNNTKRFSKSSNHISLQTRVHRFTRMVKGMLDNPVALKNMKDPYYHVPDMQALDINYGSVGTLLATRVQTTARAQWLGSSQQQMTGQLSIDNYSYALRGGVGMQLNYNYFGNGGIQNYGASFIYSPKIAFGRNVVLEPSVRFKMGTKHLIGKQFEQGELVEYDRMNTQEFQTSGVDAKGQILWYKDLGAGLMVNTKWFFVGFQADNLFEHFDNIYSADLDNPRRAGRHLVATIGTDYESARKNVCLSPYVVYQQKENLSEAWAGLNLRYYWLTVGAAVSSNIEPAASIGLKFKHFMLTYNADYTFSQVAQNNQLSHQLTLRFLTKTSRVGQRLLNQ